MSIVEFIKKWMKIIVVRALILAVGMFYASIAMMTLLYKRLRYGSTVWEVKQRSLPPLCLQDAAYGRHAFVRLKDLKIHYVENGDRSKPLMLFVHGFPEFWFSWRNQLKHFSSSHWVVAFDMRGYGDSDKPSGVMEYKIEKLTNDICELVKALGRKKCILVAHDWGGAVAWTVAAYYPQMVEKLIVLNSPHPTSFGLKIRTSVSQFLKSWYIFMFQLPYLPELFFHTEDLACFERMFASDSVKHISDEDLEGYKYTFSRKGAWTPPLNYYRSALLTQDVLSAPAIPPVTVPTLIIWGENDLALSRDLPEMTRAYVDNMEIKYIPDANHFVQQIKPDEVNRAIEDFVG